MPDHKFVGTFNNESEVLKKIEEMKEQGVSEQDMYVLARDESQFPVIRGETDVEHQSAEENWRDKFKGIRTGSDSVRNALLELGMNKKKADNYCEEVDDGRILVFVDREIGTDAHDTSAHGKDAQRRGFNSMAAYGDPEDGPSETPMTHGMAVEIDGDNNPFGTGGPGNNTNSQEEETGEGIFTGRNKEELGTAGENSENIAEVGRNRKDVPMMDRQIDDVPANDPNVEDSGPVKNDGDINEVRRTESIKDDLSRIDVSEDGLPANDQASPDVPPTDPGVNDVPDADRSLNRLSDTEYPEHWVQNAADRTKRNDSNEHEK